MPMPNSIPRLCTNHREIPLRRTLWMAIINATPDSFSDGGRADNVAHALRLLDQGADILDIGGESTRPGSDPVTPREEIRRIAPVITGIFERCAAEGRPRPLLSIDTYHPETADVAIGLGVEMLNDISGLENPEMLRIAARSGVAVCFMHMRGTPQNMHLHAGYADVVAEVAAWLADRRDTLLRAGIGREKLVADPGLGFAKTPQQNWELVRELGQKLGRFGALGVPILVGHSRKRFLADLGQDPDTATARVSETLENAGVHLLRTHAPWPRKHPDGFAPWKCDGSEKSL